MRNKNRLLRLCLIICLVLGWTVYLPTAVPQIALAENPLPPAEGAKHAAPVVLPAPPMPSSEEVELRTALEALELAHQQGPEAVLALGQTLHGKALDLAMADIVEAQRQLAQRATPHPETAPISEAEELAMLQAQAASDAAGRARALAHLAEPFAPQAPDVAPDAPMARNAPNAPSADLTVGSAPCTYATIGDAMTAANDGDRLLLEGGRVFTGSLNVDKSLTFQGGYDGCGSGSSNLTTIDAVGGGRALYIYDNLTVTLQNLNVTNANTGAYGAGIFVYTNTLLIGTNLNIYSNTTSSWGGGVFLAGARATFSDTEIFSNTAAVGAGVYGAVRGSYAPELNLASYADVHNNRALTGNGFGGGVYMNQGTVIVTNSSDIYANNATEGGGAYLISSTLTIEGEYSEIADNTATGDGGGIHALGSTINLDRDAEVFRNAAGTDGSGNGGGVYLDNSDLWSDKGLIYYNTADDHGGGVYATQGSLLDMDLSSSYPCAGPRCSQLSYNAAGSYGGGVWTADSEVDLVQIFIEGNSSALGGGIYAWRDPSVSLRALYLYNCLLARNNGGAADGIRLYTSAGQTTRMAGSHNTLAYNPSAGDGVAIAMNNAGTLGLSLDNSIIWGHTTSINSAAAQTVTYSDIQGGYGGTGNLNVDPLFVDPAGADFHLQITSPVIDRCASGQSRDFDNEVRPITYVRPATPYDMGADEAAPHVGLNGAPCAYWSIQDAVDAAASGDTIQAAADTFTETVIISGKALTITGGYDVDCTTFITGVTTVNGGGAGSVFEINSSVTTLRNLGVTGGTAGNGGGVCVLSHSQVTLDNTDVFNNHAGNGGGAYVNTNTVLTLTNDSYIHHNTATSNGGGARVWGKLVAADTYSDIDYNSAPNGGGISAPGGTVILTGADLSGNHATAANGKGGGIHVSGRGVVTMTTNAWISGGHTAYDGAGIYADNASLYLDYFTVSGNTATNNGGGVYLAGGSRMDAEIGTIGSAGSGNRAVNGAGLYVDHSAVDFQGNLRGNVASANGGGLYADGGTLTLRDASVGGTGPNAANRLSVSGNGAGLYLSGTHASLVNTSVTSNTFPAAAWGYGGGLSLHNGSVVTLTDSTVSQHYAPGNGSGRGAGLYIQDSTVTLDHSQVVSNTADGVGGGVRLWSVSTLNILNGSELRNNHALAGAGGAIAATDTPDINISNSMLYSNTASTDGGAIYLDAGTLDFGGWWNVSNNTAGRYGGAVAVSGIGDAGFYVDTAVSSLSGNYAGSDGGALHVDNFSTLDLFADDGYDLNISGNGADRYGGVAFSSEGALFNVYGRVIITGNTAYNGGAFYLSDGSRLWLDDRNNDKPLLLANRADEEGGAIYARGGSSVECAGVQFGDDPLGNVALDGSGGAIFLSGSDLASDNCIFYNNQASANGGAIAAYTSTVDIHATYSTHTLAPQALLATACSPHSQECSRFYGNSAGSGNDGGAIYSDGSVVDVKLTQLYLNSARYGGAIYQTGAGASAWVTNTLVYSNTSNSGALHRNGGVFTVTNSTLANNLVGAGFAGAIAAASNTIAWGNTAGGFMYTPVISACNIDQSGHAGVAVDPLFVAPGAGENYHLLGSSPAIDACPTGEWVDLDNIARPVGVGYDIGAYEYAHGIAFAPDNTGSSFSPGVISYTHTLTNTGSSADTYTLSAHSGNGWEVTLDPASPVALNGGQHRSIVVTLTVPAGVVSGTLDTLVITATSQGDPTLFAVVTDTTRVSLRTYTLDVNTVGDGAVAVDPDQAIYLDGTAVTLTATPAPGWYFSQWSGNASGAMTTTTVVMDAHKTVTATFTPIPPAYYTLTMGIAGSGVVTPSVGTHTYLSGTVVNLQASPATGWDFDGWTGDLESGDNPATLTMDGNKEVTATFSAATFVITPTAGAGGQIIPATPQTVAYGGDIAFTIVPDTGYHIADVGVDGVSQGGIGSYTFSNVTADHTFTATFALNEYTLTVDVVGDGAVAVDPDQPTYLHGATVTLTATPGAGWYFGQWSGDASGAMTTTTVVMDAHKTVTATFSSTPPAYYTLTMGIVGSGVVTPSVGTHTYLSGTVVQLEASPDTDWEFTGWSGSLSGLTNPASLLMDGHKGVTATFAYQEPLNYIYLPLVLRNY